MVLREKKTILLIISRKILILRKKILRRKADEVRTQTYTLDKPAQSKYISTCHKSRTIQNFIGNKLQPRKRSI